MLNPSDRGKGAVASPIDLRNFRFDVAEASFFPGQTLPAQYDLSDKIQWIKDQYTSSACGGEAFSYYMELLSYLRDGVYTKLSAKDLYSAVRLPGGGSSAGALLNRLANAGIAEEADIDSTNGGKPVTEGFMASQTLRSNEANERAMQYWTDSSYVTFNSRDIEQTKKAIYTGNGAIIIVKGNNYCWTTNNGNVLVPAPGTTTWSHFILLLGWNEQTREFKFINSWGSNFGDKGFGYLPYDYLLKGYGSDEWTVLELSRDKYSNYMKTIGYLKNLIQAIKLKLNK